MVAQGSNPDPLVEAILAQAEAEAKKLKEAAEITARQLVGEAEELAARHREAGLLAEADRTKRENTSILARTRLETRRRILEAREELIDRAFAQLQERLEGLRKNSAYSRVFISLVQEGIAALDGDNFIVLVVPEDRELASRVLIESPIDGKRLEVTADNNISGGGCIIWQSDQRSFYDNTFSSIVARHRLRLRIQVAEILWGRQTRWDDI